MTKHLSHEQLLRHLDGELSRFAAWQAAAHLKTCWACQVEFDHLKEQIAAIVDAQSVVFGPSLPPPPGPWARLEPRLERARSDAVPVWKKVAPFAGRSLRARLAYCGAALAVVAVGFSLWLSPRPVLAKEVLTRVAASDRGRLAITERKVARQRVRVARTSVAAPAKSARVDSWKSTKSTYWDSDAAVGTELLARYKSNGLESALPLSPEVMETWVNIAGGERSATRDKGAILVEVAANEQGRARGLEAISLHVRSESWHLYEMDLSFSDASYRISEEESSVMAREDVPGDIMSRLEQPQPASIPVAESPAVSRPATAPDLDDLEMGVRSDLHRIGADLGEGIEIVPQPPDRLRVEARQVAPETRENLVALLGKKPGVQLDFQAPGGETAGPRVTRVIPQAGGSIAPADPRLAAFFGSTEAQENYTQTVFDTSNSVLAHLYALRELAARWSEDQERRLSAGARSTLHAMVRDHVTAVGEASSRMRKQLAPLLDHFGIPVTEPAGSDSGVTWREAGKTLDAALRVDQTLRSLLTNSDSPLSIEQALPRLRQGLGGLQGAAVRP